MKHPTGIILLTVLLLVGNFAYAQDDTIIEGKRYPKIYRINYNGLHTIWNKTVIPKYPIEYQNSIKAIEAKLDSEFIYRWSGKSNRYFSLTYKDFIYAKSKEMYYDELISLSDSNEKIQPRYEIDYNNDCSLSSEGLLYTDARIGHYISYGKHNNVLESENWFCAFDKNTVNYIVKDRLWEKFNENGILIYSELWDRGNFVKEFPECDTNSIASFQMILNNRVLNINDTISLSDINKITLKSKYRNSSLVFFHDSVEVYISSHDSEDISEVFKLKSFCNFSSLKLSELNLTTIERKLKNSKIKLLYFYVSVEVNNRRIHDIINRLVVKAK